MALMVDPEEQEWSKVSEETQAPLDLQGNLYITIISYRPTKSRNVHDNIEDAE